MPGYTQSREHDSTREVYAKITTAPNYKEPLSLKRFVTDRGKLVPAKRTGASAKMQRIISREVKRARFMALLPYTDRHAL
jgi:small subunit ribosomal protein S18